MLSEILCFCLHELVWNYSACVNHYTLRRLGCFCPNGYFVLLTEVEVQVSGGEKASMVLSSSGLCMLQDRPTSQDVPTSPTEA